MRQNIKAVLYAFTVGSLFLFGCSDNLVNSNKKEPVIITHPKSIEIDIGNSFSLAVSVEDEKSLSFQWYKNESEINGATDSVFGIENVRMSDMGQYYVVVSNKSASVKSNTALVSIVNTDTSGKPVIVNQSRSKAMDLGTPLKLFIQVSGDSPFTYVWYKNDSVLESEADSTLDLGVLSSGNVGEYYAIVSNSKGADTSEIIIVTAKPGDLFIMQSDFQSGVIRSISSTVNSISGFNLPVHSDATLRTHGGFLYVIERMGADNILKYDPSKSGDKGVVYQTNLGNNWNPQDMVFRSNTKAYISNMNEPKITVFNPSTGKIRENINISEYTFNKEANITPYANAMVLVGTDLYVMLQRRDGWSPGAPTLLLKIDTETDKITDTIPLQFKNGHSMVYNNGALYVSNPGTLSSINDGAIERVDLATKTVTTVIKGETLGGSPNYIVHKSGNSFYITNYVGWQSVQVLEINASTGSVTNVLPNVIDAFGGIYYDKESEILYVGERDIDEMGIRIFKNNQQIGSSVKSEDCLPPTSLVVVR
ncbi:hypothetical protein CHISP_3448 [Chitinispirillum alkaliphilum]|nr:hypothetical protein CHISP_3448 [Chitinispirillum alkaliphilum]